MARSQGSLLTLCVAVGLLAAAVSFASSVAFVPPQPRASGDHQQALIASAALASIVAPTAAFAADFDVDSSVAVAGTVEPLMMGIVMGCVPITIFGLFVAAWLQFKKGPTLGV
mmetsp:Transcript_159563/g.512030  ORF Transcript_159563/g.512030 Transcript_159563/m.512030 type:complete len:113 (-) Transcript_159563:93-431(-)